MNNITQIVVCILTFKQSIIGIDDAPINSDMMYDVSFNDNHRGINVMVNTNIMFLFNIWIFSFF